jgi:hypothetical protein
MKKTATVQKGYSWKKEWFAHPTCGAQYFLLLDGKDLPGWGVQHCGHPTANWPYSIFYGDYIKHGLTDLRELKAQVIELHKQFLETGKQPNLNTN